MPTTHLESLFDRPLSVADTIILVAIATIFKTKSAAKVVKIIDICKFIFEIRQVETVLFGKLRLFCSAS